MTRLTCCIAIAIGWVVCGSAGAQAWPAEDWAHATPSQVQMDEARLQEAARYALGGGGAGMVVRNGFQVYSWGDPGARFDLKSTTKSIGATALGLALADARLSLSDAAQQHLPDFGLPPRENSATGWLDDVAIINLATHTAGLPKTGGYGPLSFAPGTRWSYSDGGVNWIADVLTAIYREDLNALLFRRVFSRLGIAPADLVWRSNRYRADTLEGVKRREFGSGMDANADAMARIGYLYLREGNWQGEQIIPASFVAAVRRPHPAFTSLDVADSAFDPDAPQHYGLLWWTNADGSMPGVPADAYWSWGFYDSLIVVIPSLDIVAVRAGPKGFAGPAWDGNYATLAPFMAPIAQSVSGLTVPSVVASTLEDATAEITAAGLTVGTVSQRADANVAEGTVLDQSPAPGNAVNGGSPVALTVAESGSGPGPRRSDLDLDSPVDGSWVSGRVAIAGVASSEPATAEVTVAIDGELVHSSPSNAFHVDWDTTAYSNGQHAIRVTASIGGETVASETRNVTVDNYAGSDAVPYPYSSEIVGFEIGGRSSMVSMADGSDNWPITWADDGNLYTAYGDGKGFRQAADRKLSLGFAEVTGSPPEIEGMNIPSRSGEQLGASAAGKKASGMLMVDGVLYMWVRNANKAGEQCQLAWSTDHAKTWNWSPWQFEAFGYCAFLNFGQDYAGARDGFVYMYTPDSPSAYGETDRVALTRVPKGQILTKSAYEFFAGLDAGGNPLWSPDIGDRKAVYEFRGGVNRLDVVYDAGLGRYLMTMRAADRSSAGNPVHFSVYDAPEPWGPWTTVYYTNTFYGEPLPSATGGPGGWGEAQRFPSKWIEPDGTGLQLLCSCSDTFSTVPARLYPRISN